MAKIKRTILAASIIPFLFNCQTLTNFFISDEQEVELGDKFQAQILSDTVDYPQYKPGILQHDSVIGYVNAMGQRLAAAQKDRTNITFTFNIIANDTIINAFAIPGGHIFIYMGTLRAANSAAEVACVLAHEIGHVTMRHGAKQLMKSEAVGLVNTILFGSDSTSIANAVAQACENMVFLKFSRDDESQADSCAVKYSTAAQYNAYGMIHFFQTLMAKYPDGNGPYEVLSDHPATADRITAVQRIIGKTANVPPDDTTWTYPAEYAAIKAKL
ncbi:MAG TPA: M48 family metallopeptidase [Chitinivibrionales bacterium]|nr:M48 family metallopeptidase [Chitinivibrionales bacterium]